MKKFLSILAVASTAMYFTSCSKSDVTDVGDDKAQQPMEIKVGGKALSITPGKTRAPFEGIAVADLKARVLASNTSKKYDAAPDLINSGAMTFKNTITTAIGFDDGAVPYPHATNNVYMVGLYPMGSTDWAITESGSKAKFTFNGSHDVMAADEVITTRAEATSAVGYKTLNFHHLLTRLNLTVLAKDQAAKDAWGDVTSIKVKSPANDVTVTFKTADTNPPTTAFGTTETIFPFYEIAKETALPTIALPLEIDSPSAQSYALVAPKNGNNSTQVFYELIVTAKNYTENGSEKEYPITVNLESAPNTAFNGNTQGLKFDIKLTFSATDIKAFATVKAWVDGGTGGATIQ